MFSKGLIQQASVLNLISRNARRYILKNVALIGVPFSGGQPRGGVEEGPKALRDGGLIQRIEELGREVDDFGDVQVPEYSSENPEVAEHEGCQIKNSKACGLVSERVANLVEKGARENKICLTIGGDHSISTGSIIGHQRARPNTCVLWIDAHNDLNNHKNSPSGNIHGMALSFVLKGLKENMRKMPGYEWAKPCLTPFDLVYIGLRDTDPGEYMCTHDLGILTFSMHEVDRYGISTVVERAIESMNPRLDRPIHVSYDIDSLDPLHSPSTGTAVYGGLTLREGLYIGEYVNKLGLLAALDIVEVNPRLGQTAIEAELTVNTAIRLTEACLGKHRSGYIAKRTFDFKA